ncbi:MAG: DUF2550 family protein [Actinomycetaceae bacterium]|nr:DUF2550 family protein [Actinomycetaceae bacterium]MDY6082773.1 DUF2550 family protein [Actinomycetaceae bacterium]
MDQRTVIVGVEIAVLVFAVLSLLSLLLRYRLLLSTRGAFQCSVRRGKRWVLGVTRYRDDRLDWYPLMDWVLKPRLIILRAGMDVQEHRQSRRYDNVMYVTLRSQGRTINVAMSPSAFAGIVAWMDAAPPQAEPVL